MNAHRLTLAVTLLVAHGCGFTSEPDPGHGDVDLGGAPADDAGAAPDGSALLDQGGAPDASPPPPDAAVGDMQTIPDAAIDLGPDDLGPDAADLDDLGPEDLGPDAADLGDPDATPDATAPDLGPAPDPLARACDRLCTTLAACRPAPDPAADAACRPDCRDRNADPELIGACHATHLAADRCHIDGYRRCEAGLPPPIDPRCPAACDALAACRFPQSPDCALECDGAPGPERRLLARCAEAHTTGPCDIIGFIDCAAADPTPADHCDYACAVLADCGHDPACPESCPRDSAAYDTDCIEAHLDRGACATRPYDACLER